MNVFFQKICYVGSCAIKKTSQISLSGDKDERVEQVDQVPELNNNLFHRPRSNSLKEQVTDFEFLKKVLNIKTDFDKFSDVIYLVLFEVKI